MAEKKKDLGADQGSEKRTREIDELKSFSGGQVKSVEPEVEVHETLHHYAGGEIIERSSTQISPVMWGFWAVVLVGIAATVLFWFLPGYFNPAMRGANARSVGYGGAYAPAGGNGGGTKEYMSLSSQMQTQMTDAQLTSPTFIDMYALPRPQGQSLKQAIAAGSTLYGALNSPTGYCIGCHGPNQDGNGVNSASLDPKPRNFRDVPFMQAMSYQRIWTSVHKGVPGTAMPRWENTLSDTQIQDVICYVLSLTAPQNSTTGQFIRPTPAEIAGAAGPSAPALINPGSPHSLAPATGPGTATRKHAHVAGPITGPPSHG